MPDPEPIRHPITGEPVTLGPDRHPCRPNRAPLGQLPRSCPAPPAAAPDGGRPAAGRPCPQPGPGLAPAGRRSPIYPPWGTLLEPPATARRMATDARELAALLDAVFA